VKRVWRGFAFWFSALIVPAILGYSTGKLSAQSNSTINTQAPTTHPLYGRAHPDLELYYQQRRAAESVTAPAVRPQGYTQFNVTATQANKPMQTTDFIAAFADLGGTLGALGFASWLVVFLLRQHDTERQAMRSAFTSERERVQQEREKERSDFHEELEKSRAEFASERTLHLQKDSQNDEALHASMTRSQEQLLTIVENNARQVHDLKDIMASHSNDLKAILLEMKMAVSTGFEKVQEKWDGSAERRTPSPTDRRRSKRTDGVA